MAARVQTWGREAGGWTLLGLAVVLFPLPFVPSLLLVAGLLILSSRHSWAEALLGKARAQFPSLFRRKLEAMVAEQAVS